MDILSILLTIILTINGVSFINAYFVPILERMRTDRQNITFNNKWCESEESVNTRCYIDRKSGALCQTAISSQCGPCRFPAGKSVNFNSLKSDLTCSNALAPGVYYNQPGGITLLSFLGNINQQAPKWTMCLRPSHNKPSLTEILRTPCVGSDCIQQVVDFRVCALDSPSQEITADCFSNFRHTLQAYPGQKGLQIYIEETFSCGHCIIEASIKGSAIGCFPVVIKPTSSESQRIQRRSINSANETSAKDDNANSTDKSSAAQTASLTDSKALKTVDVITAKDDNANSTDKSSAAQTVSLTDSKALKTDDVINFTETNALKTDGLAGIITNLMSIKTNVTNLTEELHTQHGYEHRNTSSGNYQSTEGSRTTIANLKITTEDLQLNHNSEVQGESVIILNADISANDRAEIAGGTVGFNVKEGTDHNGTVGFNVKEGTDHNGTVGFNVKEGTDHNGTVGFNVKEATDHNGTVGFNVKEGTDHNGTVGFNVKEATDHNGKVGFNVKEATDHNGTVGFNVKEGTDHNGTVGFNVKEATDHNGTVGFNVKEATDHNGTVGFNVKEATDHNGTVGFNVKEGTDHNGTVGFNVKEGTDHNVTVGFNVKEGTDHNGTGQELASKKKDSSLILEDEAISRTSFAKVDTNIPKALPKSEKSTSNLQLQTAGISTEFQGSSVQMLTSMSFEDEWNMHEKEAEKHEMDIQANLGNSSSATTEPDPAAEPDPFLALSDNTLPLDDTPPKATSPARLPNVVMVWSCSVFVLVAFSAKRF